MRVGGGAVVVLWIAEKRSTDRSAQVDSNLRWGLWLMMNVLAERRNVEWSL